MGRRLVVILLAGACIAAVVGVVLADATTSRPSGRAVAKRKLVGAGYDLSSLKCSTKHPGTRKARTNCAWSGLRRLSRCKGSVTVAYKRHGGRSARVTGTQCDHVLVGFNTFTNARTVGLQRSVGATVRRIITPWSLVEPAPNVWNWVRFDQQYKAAIDAGFRPLMIATEAPCWARPLTGCPASGPPDPSHDGDWRQYVQQMARRYPKALGIEIWNEPNLRILFWPQPDPARYASLLQQAYGAIKAVDPDMKVVSGGILAHGVSGESFGGMGDVTFLQRMLAAGAGNAMDAIAVHPYPYDTTERGVQSHWTPGAVKQTLDTLRGVAAQAGVTKPFWITEVGESTSTQEGYPLAITPEQQAHDLTRILDDALKARDVEVVVIHTLGDAPRDGVQVAVDNVLQPPTGVSVFYNGVNSGFGVFDSKDRPKPAACALSKLLGGKLDC